MVSFKFLTLALAGAVAAIDFQEWAQHNGLVSHFNQFYKTDPALQDMINNLDGDYTIFLPTDNAWSRWQSNKTINSESYTATSQTFMYMIVQGAYTIKDLETKNGDSLTTMLQGAKVQVTSTGVVPNLTPVILSGSDHDVRSIAGRYQDDFQCDQAMIQLVDTVFQLPDQLFTKANKNKSQVPSRASTDKIPYHALSMLSAGAALTTITSFLF